MDTTVFKIDAGEELIPVRNCVTVKVQKIDKKIGSIELPDDSFDSLQRAVVFGELVKSGPVAFLTQDGLREDIFIPGRKVAFCRYAGVEYTQEEDPHRVMNDTDILGYVSKKMQ